MKTIRAFTLVEVLVVIVIISILAALVTVAVAGAMRAGQRARIGVQMSQIAMNLEHYKAEFGEYPPDMSDDDALVRHVKKRWPRYDAGNAQQIRANLSTAYGNNVDFTVDLTNTNFSPSLGALALWLGGFPNADGKLSGFGADPENPFTITNGVFDGKVFIDGEVGNDKNVRFVDFGGGVVPVIGNEIRDVFVPIVYFRGRTDGGEDAYRINEGVKHFLFSGSFSEFGLCVPYVESERTNNDITTIKWHNPTTYQLIHPGLDGKFSAEVLLPPNSPPPSTRITALGTGIGQQDLDNITNFSDYKELKSILP